MTYIMSSENSEISEIFNTLKYASTSHQEREPIGVVGIYLKSMRQARDSDPELWREHRDIMFNLMHLTSMLDDHEEQKLAFAIRYLSDVQTHLQAWLKENITNISDEQSKAYAEAGLAQHISSESRLLARIIDDKFVMA